MHSPATAAPEAPLLETLWRNPHVRALATRLAAEHRIDLSRDTRGRERTTALVVQKVLRGDAQVQGEHRLHVVALLRQLAPEQRAALERVTQRAAAPLSGGVSAIDAIGAKERIARLMASPSTRVALSAADETQVQPLLGWARSAAQRLPGTPRELAVAAVVVVAVAAAATLRPGQRPVEATRTVVVQSLASERQQALACEVRIGRSLDSGIKIEFDQRAAVFACAAVQDGASSGEARALGRAAAIRSMWMEGRVSMAEATGLASNHPSPYMARAMAAIGHEAGALAARGQSRPMAHRPGDVSHYSAPALFDEVKDEPDTQPAMNGTSARVPQ
jgi:hypothetical protein